MITVSCARPAHPAPSTGGTLALALYVRPRLGWHGWTTVMVVVAAVVPLGGLVVERRRPDDAPGRQAIDRGHRASGAPDAGVARSEAGALSS